MHLSLFHTFVLSLAMLAPRQEAVEASDPVQEAPQELEQAEGRPPLELPSSLQEALAIGPSKLERLTNDRSRTELEQLLEGWMQLLDQQQASFEAAVAAEEGTELRDSADRLGAERDTLLASVEVLAVAVADAGGSAESARTRLAAIRQHDTKVLDEASTVPRDQSEAQDLPVEILRAELRPLTKEQVSEQLRQWLELLQRKCLEVRNAEVAALESTDTAEAARFSQRAVELRGERGRLIERARVVADALERKNGEVEDARAYLKSVLTAPPITGLRAAWTTSRAWLLSADGGIDLGVRLAKAIATIVVFWLLSVAAGRVTGRAVRSARGASRLLRDFITGSVRKAVLFTGLLMAASQMGINMGPLIAVIGAAGLVVGFALQGTLSNFASGLLIMIYRPFDVGDTVNAGGASGIVESMTLVTTLIKTFDNQSVHVPNNKIWGDVITNVTANPTRRVDLTVGVSYSADLEVTQQVLLEVASSHPFVLKYPKPNIRVHALGDSSVQLIVRPWTKTADYWTVYWDLTRTMKERLEGPGVSIPFPQMDVHLHVQEGAPASEQLQGIGQ